MGLAQRSHRCRPCRALGQASEQPNGGETKSGATSAPAAGRGAVHTLFVCESRRYAFRNRSAASDPSPNRRNEQAQGRAVPRAAPNGFPRSCPSGFGEKDANGDGQVDMAEYASDWTADMVKEFNRYDLNRDGIITAVECLKVEGSQRNRNEPLSFPPCLGCVFSGSSSRNPLRLRGL